MNQLRRAFQGLLALVIILAGVVPCEARDAMYGVSSRGSTAVAVGDSGRILYSPEAPHNVVWNGATTTLVNPLRAVTTGANDYVAVGDGGTILRSTSGVGNAWTPRTSHIDLDLFGVTHASDRLIAVGDSGTILRSASQTSDDWTPITGVPTVKPLRAVVGGGLYTVAVGDSGTILWSSTNNTSTWFPADVIPTVEDLLGVAEGPGNPTSRFWAVGRNGTLLRSIPSARDWEILDSTVGVDLHGVAFAFLTSGWIGVAVGDNGTILYSNGGQTWTAVESATAENLYAVSYTGTGEANGGFVAVGEANTIVWSAEGTVWQGVVVPILPRSWGRIRGSWGSAR